MLQDLQFQSFKQNSYTDNNIIVVKTVIPLTAGFKISLT